MQAVSDDALPTDSLIDGWFQFDRCTNWCTYKISCYVHFMLDNSLYSLVFKIEIQDLDL